MNLTSLVMSEAKHYIHAITFTFRFATNLMASYTMISMVSLTKKAHTSMIVFLGSQITITGYFLYNALEIIIQETKQQNDTTKK